MDEHRPPEKPDELDETGPAAARVVDEGVTDNRAANRLELVTGGGVAFLNYERTAHSLVFLHTEVPPALRGRGIGKALVKAGLETARREGLRSVPVCPFVQAFLRKHPESSEIGRNGRMSR